MFLSTRLQSFAYSTQQVYLLVQWLVLQDCSWVLMEVKCTMPKRQAVVIFPEVNYELTLVMENVERESWRQSTSSPKIGILVLIMHTAWSPNTSG
jgi:hypothetical protein